MMKISKVLYLSLTGMTEVLGRSQVLEYLIDLSQGNEIFLISFEKEKDLENIVTVEKLISQHNIKWKYFIYSNKYGFISTLIQICQAVKYSSHIIMKHNVNIIHARSMIPATIGFILKRIYGAKLLFDIRGFSVDEKLDSNRLKKGGFLHKILKKWDNYLYEKSDHIVTLTYRAKEILHKDLDINNNKMTVIPTCANKDIFLKMSDKEKIFFKKQLGFQECDIIIIHTGTVSGWYDFDNEVKLVKELMSQDDNINFLVLNKHEHLFIEKVFNKFNLPKEKVKITSSSFTDMYKYLNISDYSLFFIKPSYSKQASAPTKFAENVACLLPSITNIGVGDMEYYMNKYNVGYLLNKDLLESDLSSIVTELIQKMYSNIIDIKAFEKLFDDNFDKKIAVNQYNSIYSKLQDK